MTELVDDSCSKPWSQRWLRLGWLALRPSCCLFVVLDAHPHLLHARLDHAPWPDSTEATGKATAR